MYFILRSDVMQAWNGEKWVSKEDGKVYDYMSAYGVKSEVESQFPLLMIRIHWEKSRD